MSEMVLPGLPNKPAHLNVMNVPFAPGHAHSHYGPHHHRGRGEEHRRRSHQSDPRMADMQRHSERE